MKKEQLEKIGLTAEQITQVFALNGADIQKYKDDAEAKSLELSTVREQLAQRDVDLEGLKNAQMDADGFKKQFEDLQAKYNADNEAWQTKLANEQKGRLIDAELSKVGARDIELLKQVIDSEAVKVKDGKLIGLAEQVASQKESRPFLFNGEQKAQYQPNGGTGAQHGYGKLEDELKNPKFNLTEYLQYKKENGDE